MDEQLWFFFNLILIDPVDIVGGLCLAWKSHLSVIVIKWMHFMIHATVQDDQARLPWDISFLHINSDVSSMKDQFDFVINYANNLSDEHLFLDDFNAILNSHEKLKDNFYIDSKTIIFRDFVN